MELWDQLRIRHYQSVESTNDIALTEAKNRPDQAALYIADEQTKGRGRHGRDFYSSLAHGCYLSLYLPTTQHNYTLPISLWTIAVAVAVAQSIEEHFHQTVQLKWINDIFYQYKKIGGILCETVFHQSELQGVVIGVGLNLAGTFDQADTKTQHVAGTLLPTLPSTFDRLAFIKTLTHQIDHILNEPFHAIRAVYQHYLLGLGTWIRYTEAGVEKNGQIQGISEDGQLCVRDRLGQMHQLISQQVSIGSHQFYSD